MTHIKNIKKVILLLRLSHEKVTTPFTPFSSGGLFNDVLCVCVYVCMIVISPWIIQPLAPFESVCVCVCVCCVLFHYVLRQCACVYIYIYVCVC